MSNRPIRIGLQIQPQQAEYDAIRRTVAQAEELGVDIIFNWDHFYPLYGEADGKHFECWTMVGAWAEQTSGRRNRCARLVQQLSQPRTARRHGAHRRPHERRSADLGIGSGWFQRDYDEYGYEVGTAGGRLNTLRDDLPRIEARWAKLNPAPIRKIPVLIGGGGEKKTLRRWSARRWSRPVRPCSPSGSAGRTTICRP